MTTLLISHAVLGLVALLVLGFVAFPHRGRGVPRSQRLSATAGRLVDRVDPGVATPHGMFSTPERSREIAARFERAEGKVRKLVTAGRG